MKTISVLSQKGGAGKTTLAVHLAAEAASRGQRVLIIDMDPQGSAIAWAGFRGDLAPDVDAGHHKTLPKEVERAAADGYDLIVIDTAPHADGGALAAARVSDLVLVPCRPATFDLIAIAPTLDICNLARKPRLAVVNAAPVRSRVVEEAAAALVAAGVEVSSVTVRQRVAFQHCLSDGRVASEFEPGGTAAEEIGALLDDLNARMRVVTETI